MLWILVSAAAAETVTTRDGVALATDVWNPVGEGPWPVVLRRTPYGRAIDAGTITAVNLLGYSIVSQDVRGRGDSAGEFLPFFNDGTDGVDTVDWIRAQDWSDGHVCMLGGSAEGIVQVLAAGEGAALDCIVPIVTSGDMRASLFPGGAWRTDLTTNWLDALGENQVEPLIRASEVDSDFWDPVRLDATEYARIDAAVFLIGGFFDIFESELPHLATGLEAAGRGEDTWLLLGPWTHGGIGATTQGEVEFTDAAYSNLYPDLFAFYDWKMKGGTRPDWARVRFALSTFADDADTAASVWREAEVWPPDAPRERLFLGVDGLGAAPGGDEIELVVDPADPVPSVGGGNLTTAAGPFDQTEVDRRSDVWVGATAPATGPVEVVGNATARIWAASATTDVDVIVRVEIVPAHGKAWLVADGVRRGRFLGGEDAIRPLTPGEAVPFDLDLGPMAYTLTAGQSLRIAISGTLSPRFEPNPNEAVALEDEPTPVATTLTVLRDVDHPSSVDLPLPTGTLGGVEAPDPEDTGSPTGTDGTGCGCTTSGAGGFASWVVVALAAVGLSRRSRRSPSGLGSPRCGCPDPHHRDSRRPA